MMTVGQAPQGGGRQLALAAEAARLRPRVVSGAGNGTEREA